MTQTESVSFYAFRSSLASNDWEQQDGPMYPWPSPWEEDDEGPCLMVCRVASTPSVSQKRAAV